MQNKSAIWLFTILLTIAALYILSFSVVSSNFETKAETYVNGMYADSLNSEHPGDSDKVSEKLRLLKDEYLRDSAKVQVVPIIGLTYEQVKQKELNLGLDLRGGMSVTLEVSLPDLVNALSSKDPTPAFQNALKEAKTMQQSDDADYITLFERAWGQQNTDVELWRIFHKQETKELFPARSTDDEIFATLRSEAEQAIDNTENIIKKRIDQFGVAQPTVQKQSFTGRIVVELPGVKDREGITKKLKSTANLEFWNVYRTQEVFQSFVAANNALALSINPELFEEDAKDTTNVVDDAVDAATDAIDDLTQTLEGDTLNELLEPEESDETAAADDISDEERRKRSPLFSKLSINQVGNSCVAGYAIESDMDDVTRMLKMDEVKGNLPQNLRLLWGASPENTTDDGQDVYALYMIKDDNNGKPRLDGSSIVDARAEFDFGEPIVTMAMDAAVGTPTWRDMTEKAAADSKRPIAVVMDSLVYSAPSVNEPIANGRSQISMGGNRPVNEKLEDAQGLASLLKAGSLPAPAKIVDEYSVGPSLGQANINSGLISFLIALMVILVYMVFYYKGAGLVSNVALIANLFFLLGALASLGASLTLPGIAGIVLTIGMAVDANVLIYERIREEMRNGKGLTVAVKEGYGKAYSAIIDANITTLLTAIILFSFGSGPIQGFATTLIIGIFTSLFSAIIITRLIFFSRLEKKQPISFWTNMTKDWFTKMNYQFVTKRKLFYAISGTVIALGIGSMYINGLNYGIDFEGGSSFTVAFEEVIDDASLRTSMQDAFKEGGQKGNPTIQAIGNSGAKYKIATAFMKTVEADDKDEQVMAALNSGLSSFGKYEIEEEIKVDPTISDDFRRGARNATILSLIVIFLYIFLRFRKWQYGVGALIAMIHDVLIVLSLFSLFKGILPFSMEVNQAFIAAILTVIGYSINDTVVVFDRIREYLRENKKGDDKEVINNALNSTLSRTINTSLSTFVVLLTIFIFGGDDIRGFSFALMIGVVVGTYSSIFIATPSVIDMSKSARVEN